MESNKEKDVILDEIGTFSTWIKSVIGEVAFKKLWGEKPSINFQDPMLTELFKLYMTQGQDNFLDVLQRAEFDCSTKGYAGIVISKLGKRLILSKANMIMPVVVGGILVEVTVATQVTRGAKTYFINKRYTDTEINTEIEEDLKGTRTNTPLKQYNTEWGANESKTQKNSLGFIPVVFMENKPSDRGFGKSDWAGFQGMLDVLDIAWYRIGWELVYTQSSMVIGGDGLGNAEYDRDRESFKEAAAKRFSQSNVVYNKSNQFFNQNGLEHDIVQFNMLTEQPLAIIDRILSLILTFAGYSDNSNPLGGVSQKTEFEIGNNRSGELETFQLKKLKREAVLKELIQKMMKFWFKDPSTEIIEGVSFYDIYKEQLGDIAYVNKTPIFALPEVKVNMFKIENLQVKVNNEVLKLQAGLTNRVQSMMELNPEITEEEANQILVGYLQEQIVMMGGAEGDEGEDQGGDPEKKEEPK